MITIHGFQIPLSVVVLGASIGTTYGLLAVGLAIVYRSSSVINFAHTQIGAFGAAVFGLAVTGWGIPYWVAFLPAVAVAAGTGGLTELLVIRRLRRAPSLMTIVATIGVGALLLQLSDLVSTSVQRNVFPAPPGIPSFHVQALTVTPSYTGMLLSAPITVVVLVWFFRRTRLGLAVRGASANTEGARMLGVPAARMATVAWALAGALSGLTALLVTPTRGFSANAASLGPDLLLRGLVPVVVARMTNLPVAMLAGIGLGIVEQVLLWNSPDGSTVQVTLTAVLLVVLLLQRRAAGRRRPASGWTLVRPWKPLTPAQRQHFLARNLGWFGGALGLLVALLGTYLMTNSAALTMVTIAAFCLVGLSLSVITGLGGELSLGQFAIAGVGAVASYWVVHATSNTELALLAAGCAAAAASLAIGLPSLRVRGLMLAVTTLGLALAAQAWLFQQSWAFGNGKLTKTLTLFSWRLSTPKRYMVFAIIVLGIGLLIVRNVRVSGIGRRLIAVRDNEDAARAFGLSASRVKLQGMAIGGFVAGLGGAVYAHSLTFISSATFPVTSGIDVVTMTVLGGIGTLAGPLLGSMYIIGIPRFLPLGSAGLAATAFGWLILILYAPGGLAQLLAPIRSLALRLVTRPSDAARPVGESTVVVPDGLMTHRPLSKSVASGPLLRVQTVSKRYGGVHAVDAVDLEVFEGETLGLIGPNGAGKTTLFEIVSGFVRQDGGRVEFRGQDISRLSPERRVTRGMVRSFQDAALFSTMPVEDVLKLALERRYPTRLMFAVIGVDRAHRKQGPAVDELLELMGLGGYRGSLINELSTGTRRIVDLACAVALNPALLLLDEPSSGIAQREVEQLAELLEGVKRYLGTTMMIIEHDIPLVNAVADRVVAMETGRIIATGSPAQVCADPAVITSYLGSDPRAIHRSEAGLAPHESTSLELGSTGTRV